MMKINIKNALFDEDNPIEFIKMNFIHYIIDEFIFAFCFQK